jgi:hypothetical protein
MLKEHNSTPAPIQNNGAFSPEEIHLGEVSHG